MWCYVFFQAGTRSSSPEVAFAAGQAGLWSSDIMYAKEQRRPMPGLNLSTGGRMAILLIMQGRLKSSTVYARMMMDQSQVLAFPPGRVDT